MNKAEKDALVALLEDETFEDAEALAEAVYNKSMDLLAQRDSYGIRLDHENGTSIAYGPFWDKNSAKRALKERPDGELRRMRAASAWTAPLTRLNEQSAMCHKCGHHKHLHNEDRGCITGLTLGSKGGTRGRACGCREGLTQ